MFFFVFFEQRLKGTISPPLRRSVWESRQSGTQAFVSVSVVCLFYTDGFKVNRKLDLFCLFLEQTANRQDKLNNDDNVIVLSSTLQNTHFRSRIQSHNRNIIE